MADDKAAEAEGAAATAGFDKGAAQSGPADEVHVELVEGADGAETEAEASVEDAPPLTDARTLRIRLLERELAEREQTLHEYIRAHKKAQADLDAFRERLRRDQAEEVEAGRAKVVERLLDVHDNLARTVEAAKSGGNTESLRSGVELVERQFLQRLHELGLERIDPLGSPFDPGSMEALSVVPVDSPEQDGKVIATVRPGFRLGQRELRPASVVVGRYA
ncbi:MAG: nucleotide exchange factor GrpE [Myxococcota bacterium]